jgi:tetratricopeptide (TPR) repeat protein
MMSDGITVHESNPLSFWERVRVRTLLAGLLLALSAVVAARPVSAEDAGLDGATPMEQEAYRLYNEDKLLTARRIAEKVLAKDPSSIVGHYVLGAVYRRAEGALPTAMFHLGKARELYEGPWGRTRYSGKTSPLHREILFAIQLVAGEMEEYDYQIHVIEYHDSLYDPDLYAEHAWPLIQLGRYDLARQFAKVAVASRDVFQRSLGLNAMCAIEGEARTRQPYYDACMAALRSAEERATRDTETDPEHGTAVAVHAYNAALAAQAMLRAREVEDLALKGTRRLEFTPANPWRLLTRVYVDQGRTEDAVNALREMQRWRRRQPPHLRDQDRAETDVVFATVLLVAGETEIAYRAVTRAIDQPDRRALTTGKAEHALGAHALLRRRIQLLRAERRAEDISTLDFFSRLGGPWETAWMRMQAWGDEERVVSVLADEAILDATLQLYVQGGLDPLPVWLLGDLVEVLGPGIVEAALARVERADTFEGLRPYRDALKAEIALSRGDEQQALGLCKRALETLPTTEALLKARVAALGAEAARRQGRAAESVGLFEQAMQLDGGVVRRLGLSIPARVEVRASGSVASDVGDMLRRSPRLRRSGGAFLVRVEGGGKNLRVCLYNRHSSLLSCTDTLTPIRPETAAPAPSKATDEPAEPEEPQEPETDEDFARRVAIAFHERAFAMPVQLTTTDVSSLDGRVTASEEATREHLRGMLGDIIEDSQKRR